MDRIEIILDYWFEGIDEHTVLSGDSQIVKRWFVKDEQVDVEIEKQFGPDLIKARKGKFNDWVQTPRGRLALIILFDQFSRNIYRDSPKAFDKDLQALEYCLRSIKDGADEKLTLIERIFLYMPMMHSENLKVQEKGLEYFGRLVKIAEENQDKNADYFKYTVDYAQKHYDIIERFQRFPHRNEIFNRRSTPSEIEFLKEPGSSF